MYSQIAVANWVDWGRARLRVHIFTDEVPTILSVSRRLKLHIARHIKRGFIFRNRTTLTTHSTKLQQGPSALHYASANIFFVHVFLFFFFDEKSPFPRVVFSSKRYEPPVARLIKLRRFFIARSNFCEHNKLGIYSFLSSFSLFTII